MIEERKNSRWNFAQKIGLTLLRIFYLPLSNNGNSSLQVSRKYVSVKKKPSASATGHGLDVN